MGNLRRQLLFGLWLMIAWAVLLIPQSRAAETNVFARDPSTIVKHDGVYWVYGTGKGIQQFSSKDRLHWTYRGPVFPTAPHWIADAVPGNKDNGSWAPDVHYFNGTYHLYYCYSTFGSKVSGIGVATNATLDPKSWVDQGKVVTTGEDTDYNALDPCIIEDANGGMWLSFGSYFSGIKLIALDAKTGKQSETDSKVYRIASRPDSPGNAIEASCVYYHDGYYYLFVNWDSCCVGARSAYNVRVGRSTAITGPYLDKDGKDMLTGGGTLFLGSINDNGSGRLCDDEVGPGHVGILHDTDGDWVSTHKEWTRDKQGRTTMNVQKLAWDSDGWPRAVLDPGPYQIVSQLASHNVLSMGKDAAIQIQPYEADKNQKWVLAYFGDGFYSVQQVGTGKALSVRGDSVEPGAKVDTSTFARKAGQLWLIKQGEDGSYTLFPKSGRKSVALDVSECSPSDGTLVQQWTANGLDCQKWSLHRP